MICQNKTATYGEEEGVETAPERRGVRVRMEKPFFVLKLTNSEPAEYLTWINNVVGLMK